MNGMERDSIKDVAAEWVVRRDRGLSSQEKADFAAWLRADARHAAAFDKASASWQRFAVLRHAAAEPEPVPAGKPGWLWAAGVGLAAAVVVLCLPLLRLQHSAPGSASHTIAAATASREYKLPDGSVAGLAPGAEIIETFTTKERRIALSQGEAYFTVTKDPARPFYVQAGNVTVRAVGTAFSVRSASGSVDVLVTEGTVQITPPASTGTAMVTAGHRAQVATAEQSRARLVVTRVSEPEIARSLAWRTPMMELSGAKLAEVVAAFSARTGKQIVLGDPALNDLELGGRFPLNDVDGFVSALEQVCDLKAERDAAGVITLRRMR